jgi:hypothetical protein
MFIKFRDINAKWWIFGWLALFVGDLAADTTYLEFLPTHSPPAKVTTHAVPNDLSGLFDSLDICLAGDGWYWYNGISGQIQTPTPISDIWMRRGKICAAWHNRAMWLEHDTTYVCGTSKDSASLGDRHACYWRNDKIHFLEIPSEEIRQYGYSQPLSILRLGDTLFIGGYINGRAYLWVNGAPRQVCDTTSNITHLAVYRNALCMAGHTYLRVEGNGVERTWYRHGGQIHPVYWYPESDGSFPEHHLRMADFYSTGTRLYALGGWPAFPPRWFVWQTDTIEDFYDSSTTDGGTPGQIAVHGDKVFIAGQHGNTLALWINRTRFDLASSETVPMRPTALLVQRKAPNSNIDGRASRTGRAVASPTCRISIAGTSAAPQPVNRIQLGPASRETTIYSLDGRRLGVLETGVNRKIGQSR